MWRVTRARPEEGVRRWLGLLAHGVHLLLVILGLIGVAVLLLPQLQATRSRRTTFRRPADPDEHEQRVAALRSAVEDGRLTSAPDATTSPTTRPRRARRLALARRGRVEQRGRCRRARRGLPAPPRGGLPGRRVLPGGHAWPRLRGPVSLCLDATRRLLLVGIAGNLALIALWGVSRSVGLPFLGREGVGGWDLAAGAWELVLVAACLVGLRRSAAQRALVLGDLGRLAWSWVALSGVALVVLTLTVSQH